MSRTRDAIKLHALASCDGTNHIRAAIMAKHHAIAGEEMHVQPRPDIREGIARNRDGSACPRDINGFASTVLKRAVCHGDVRRIDNVEAVP